MFRLQVFYLLTTLLILFQSAESFGQVMDTEESSDQLVVLWTSDDPMLAERMVLMYTHAAKKQNWFSDVRLIIWGPSAKLISENQDLQRKLKSMQEDGILIEACVVCANMYGVTEKLRELGYEVKGMGSPLTRYLKSDAKILTF